MPLPAGGCECSVFIMAPGFCIFLASRTPIFIKRQENIKYFGLPLTFKSGGSKVSFYTNPFFSILEFKTLLH